MKVVLGLIAYLLVAMVAFGDIWRPLILITFGSDRLAVPGWRLFVLFVMVVVYLWLIPPRTWLEPTYKFAVFVILSMVISIASIGLYLDYVRHERLIAFGADASFEHSIFRSIRETPVDFTSYHHAGAVKNCVPYAWSYRTMNFYPLPPDQAVYMLRSDWKKRCDLIVDKALMPQGSTSK